MERKAWALTTYALEVLFLFLFLLFQDPDARLLAGFLLIVNLAGLLTLVSREKSWDGTHWLALGLLFVTTPFLVLALAFEVTGVTFLYGGVLILASLVFFTVEVTVGKYPFVDRLVEGRKQKKKGTTVKQR